MALGFRVGASGRAMPGVGLGWFEVAGHSLAAGGGARIQPDTDYAYRLHAALGALRFRDFSIGGAIAAWPTSGGVGDGGYGAILRRVLRPGSAGMPAATAPYVPQSQLVVAHFGLNDLGELGAAKPLPFQTGLRTILARFCAAAIFEDTDPSWAYTGTWNAMGISDITASCSGTQISFSSTLKDKAVWTCPSDYPGRLVLNVGVWMNASGGSSTLGVLVDGQQYPDVTLTPADMTDQAMSAKHIVHTLRFGTGAAGDPPLGQGAHTIQLTLKSGAMLAIDCAQIEADPLDGPVIVAPLANRPANYTIWAGWPGGPSLNDAAVDAWKDYERAVLAEFPNRVVEVDLDQANLNRQTTGPTADFIADGAHPNDNGHGKFADVCWSEILSSPLMTERIRKAAAVHPKPNWRYVGGGLGAGNFTTGWSNFGPATGSMPPLRWAKDDRNRVMVQGAIVAGAGAGTVIVPANTLPKPKFNVDVGARQFDGVAWTATGVRVANDGSLTLLGTVNANAGNAVTFTATYEQENWA